MANSIFKDGGGAGIGSYVVVFKNGELAPETSLLKLRRAYEAGESIFFSVIDIETKDALIPASGWIDEEGKLHLVARDFDDAKTYSLVFDANPIESQIDVHVEVKDGVDLGGDDIPSWDQIESAMAEKANLVDGKIPAEELPSYVDDVEEYKDSKHFPAEGERGKIYVALDTGLTYRWSGTQYIQIGGSDLSAGDGINIADHIVSADMDYLNEHLNFVTPDEMENKADKPLNTMQFEIPEGWDGNITQLLAAQNVGRFEKWIQMAHAVGNYCIYDQLGNYYEFLGIDDNHARLLIKPNQGDSSSDDGTVALASCVVSIEDGGLTIGDLILINHRLMPVDTMKLEIPEEVTNLPNEWTESDLELVLRAISLSRVLNMNDAATANGSAQFYDQFEHYYLIVPSGERFIWYVSLAENYNYGNRFSLPVHPQFYAFAVEAEIWTKAGRVIVTPLGNARYATNRDLASKQDTLVSGANIKTINGNPVLGEGDITIPVGLEWTIINSQMTDEERIAALRSATLPYVIYLDSGTPYFFTNKDTSYGHYHFSNLRIGTIGGSGPEMDFLSLGQITINELGRVANSTAIQGVTHMSGHSISDQRIPSAKAVADFVDTTISDYYTKAEVDAAIQAAIGDAIGGGY